MDQFKKTTPLTGKDVLNMEIGDTIFDFSTLIQYSKIPGSKNWAGENYIIRNTPQKGINWIGNYPKPLAVIIKTTGKYPKDNEKQYTLEKRNGHVNETINSNKVLTNQPKYKYPILYFRQEGKKYRLIGKYSVDKIFKEEVTLIPFEENKT